MMIWVKGLLDDCFPYTLRKTLFFVTTRKSVDRLNRFLPPQLEFVTFRYNISFRSNVMFQRLLSLDNVLNIN